MFEMPRVAVVGHSLVPLDFVCSVPGVQVSLFRKPGATWRDQDCSEFSQFWSGQFDLAILILGGNDLAFHEPHIVYERCKDFVNAALTCSTQVRVYLIEPRYYGSHSGFGITTGEFNIRRHRYNRMTKRWLRRVGQGFVDFGKPWIARHRTSDGVHFDPVGNQGLVRSLNRVIRGYFHITV